ncbi:TetR/AcrR family transcriptional regulator [Paenibacillus sp. SI8]|uniref:TetR/AcrR family transcriptional regulator n=1 Tax=unclassified Paenibacillus TaxID=185978 RepID=UPI003465AAE8
MGQEDHKYEKKHEINHRSSKLTEITEDNQSSKLLVIQRNKILGSALSNFVHTGYLGTKISSIAAEAGVSYGLVHHYYGSKAQLFTATVESGFTYLQQVRCLALSSSDNPEDQLRGWVFTITNILAQTDIYHLYNRLVMQLLGSPARHPPESIEVLNRYTQTEVETLTNVLIQAGRSHTEALKMSCIAFNTLLGSQMIGAWRPEYLEVLYEIGCNILNISKDPRPAPHVLPPIPWLAEIEKDNRFSSN